MSLYSLNRIYNERISIGGKPRNLVTLKKMVSEENVPHVDTDAQYKTKLYDLDTLEVAWKKYDERMRGTHVSGKNNRKLVEEKLKEQIDRLRQDKVLADLKIEEMKKNLISAEEVAEYLQLRYGVENALLRRILFVNAPIEVPGLEVVKARVKCEDYFNQIQDVMNETLTFWKQSHECVESLSIPEKIQSVIDKLDETFKQP